MQLTFILNDAPITVPNVPDDLPLLDLLRDRLGLTGAKRGCDEGVCGACSVLVDDRLTKACRTPAASVAGRRVTTIEGLRAPDGGLSDLEAAFLAAGAVQCGFCTPGMVIAGEALLRRNPSPTRDDIRQALQPNLCRCTGYQQIVDAIEATAERRGGDRERGRGGAAPITHNPQPTTHNSQPTTHNPQPTTHYLGNPRLQNVDGADKVSGRAKYVGDMRVPGMLVAKVLLSPLPHARIVTLDVTPALAVPGVRAAITGADFVDGGAFGWPIRDHYVLARGKVRYVGDPIAAVAADDEAAALAGLAAIVLELEPLPVVSDMTRAQAPDAPQIPDVCTPMIDGIVAPRPDAKNLCAAHIVRNGDPAPLLAACPTVLDEVYPFPCQEHAYIETEGALAIPEPDGGVMVYANNQSPFVNRGTLCAVLGLPEAQVRVIQPPVGGAFGGKDDGVYQISAQAARLALLTGKPVRLTYTRRESLVASYKRQAARIHLTLGADADGHLQAARAEILHDNGAYAATTPLATWRATMHAAGAYRYQAVSVDAAAVYTNNGYAGAMRGFGNTQATAAVEIAIDELAHRLGRDPLDFRLQNCLRTGDRTLTGAQLAQEVGLAACLESVRRRSDWDRKRAEYAQQTDEVARGVGVACYFHGIGLGAEGKDAATATLKIEDDGGITLTSGLTDYGQGSRTVFTALAAETLGVDMARIHVLRPDTHTARDSGPTVASRASVIGGNSVRVAAEKLRHTLALAAADLLHCASEQLARVGEGFVGPDEEPATFEAVVAHARVLGLQLSAEGRWQVPAIHWDFARGSGAPYFAYSFGAQVVEAAVNRRTGKVRATGIWAAHDAGAILYPQGALGQIYGGIVQGLGYGLMEAFRYENCIPQATGLAQYRIPRAGDVPEMDVEFIQTPLDVGPYGAKNMAEPVMMATAPALVNAVFHATGVRLRTIPVDAIRNS